MGVEDRFQVTSVESQVQNDFIFSSFVCMRNSVCLCFPYPDSCLLLPDQHVAVNGTRQRSNKFLRSFCIWLQGNASFTWLSFFCPCNLLPNSIDRIAASRFCQPCVGSSRDDFYFNPVTPAGRSVLAWSVQASYNKTWQF